MGNAAFPVLAPPGRKGTRRSPLARPAKPPSPPIPSGERGIPSLPDQAQAFEIPFPGCALRSLGGMKHSLSIELGNGSGMRHSLPFGLQESGEWLIPFGERDSPSSASLAEEGNEAFPPCARLETGGTSRSPRSICWNGLARATSTSAEAASPRFQQLPARLKRLKAPSGRFRPASSG